MSKPDETANASSGTKLQSLRAALSPGRMVEAIFSRQIRLQRGDHGFRLVLEGPKGAPEPAAEDPQARETAQARAMLTGLTALLDTVPGSRNVMRHLAVVEHGLQHKDAGALFLFDVPLDRLLSTLRQFDGLVQQPVPVELAALRVRLIDAIEVQESEERRVDMRQPLSSFLVDHKLEVSDARVTDFENAQADWGELPPNGPIKL